MDEFREKALANWDLINRLAIRRFGDRPLAEEAALAVMDGLLADDCRRLRSFSGKSFAAYLTTVACRLLEDFSRSRFGRKRTPAWIELLGGSWKKLYQLLCLERLGLDEAVHVTARPGEGWSKELEEAAWEIKARVTDCGAHQGLEVSLEEELEPGGDDDTAEKKEKAELFARIFSALTDADEDLVEANMEILTSVRLSMDPDEKLLLRLCYRENLNVSTAAAMLGCTRHQAHGRLRRLLARIKKSFKDAGLADELVELLR